MFDLFKFASISPQMPVLTPLDKENILTSLKVPGHCYYLPLLQLNSTEKLVL